MRTRFLCGVAAALSMSCTVASAQSQVQAYRAPAKWNNFNTSARTGYTFADVQQTAPQEAELPAPTPEPVPMPESVQAVPEMPMPETMSAMPGEAVGSGSCYSDAACAPWAGSCRPPLAKWFGGASLLFLTKENNGYRNLVIADATGLSQLNTLAVRPQASTGFEVYGGRYLHCNQWGLSVGYMLWDPSQESTLLLPPAAGDYRAAMPAWNDLSIDPGTGVATVYAHFDGAAGYRLQRNMRFQGIEVALNGFGIMGARRAAALNGCGNGWLHGLGLGHRNHCKGYGRLGGPISPSCGARVQIATSHGFRWFQADDEFQMAANINGTAGYQADDLYYDVDTENNLYGYQFGARLSYCLHRRVNMYVGGKFGLFGNHVRYNQRIGTQTTLAYRTVTPADVVSTSDSDTVFSTLGELDLGLGIRLTNAWTVRGGYRLFGLTGVASATDQFASDYASLASSSYVDADDSFILHGGYVGLDYNW